MLKVDFELLSRKKQQDILAAAQKLSKNGYTQESITTFPEFWSNAKPLGSKICATQPHLNQILELMPKCLAWLEQRQKALAQAAEQLQATRELRKDIDAREKRISEQQTDLPEDVIRWWNQCAFMLRLTLPTSSINQQILDARPLALDGDTLTLGLDSSDAVLWVQERYDRTIRTRLSQIAGHPLTVTYTTL